MTRAELVFERVASRSATYTPPDEGRGDSKWLYVGVMFAISAALFYVGRPACRNPRTQNCWRA